MARIKSPIWQLFLAVAVELTIISGFSTLVRTPPALLAEGIPSQWQEQEYRVPDDIGTPGRRQQGGVRGGCSIQKGRFTALVPAESYGVTVAAYPQFSFYLPEMSQNSPPVQVEFVLRDDKDDNKEFYKATFQSSGKSGIVSLTLPQEAGLAPLQVDRVYHWNLSIICNPNTDNADNANRLTVDGRIKRVELNAKLSSQLQQAKLADRAELYAQAGIWFDALTSLAELRRSHPKDLAVASEWAQLLQSVGLSNIAQESLVPNGTTSIPSAVQSPNLSPMLKGSGE